MERGVAAVSLGCAATGIAVTAAAPAVVVPKNVRRDNLLIFAFRYRTSCLEAIICSLSLAFLACYKRRRNAWEATAMALFYTDSLVMCSSNIESAKRWWIEVFDCKEICRIGTTPCHRMSHLS